jgi:hypothetical protein
MLIERARALPGRVRAIEERAVNLGRVQAIGTAVQKLSAESTRLASLMTWSAALGERGVVLPQPGPSVRSALDAVCRYRQQVAADRIAAAEPSNIAQVTSALERGVREYRTLLSAVWVDYMRAQVPVLNAQVLAVLRGIPGLVAEIRTLDAFVVRVDQWSRELPEDSTAVAEFDNAVIHAKEIWEERLGGGDLPVEVGAFLSAAGTRDGAPLELITPVVTEWLRGHGVLSAFRVTVGREMAGGGTRL